jgi:hypothetical protein
MKQHFHDKHHSVQVDVCPECNKIFSGTMAMNQHYGTKHQASNLSVTLNQLADEIVPSKTSMKRGHQLMDKFVKTISEKLTHCKIHRVHKVWCKIIVDLVFSEADASM